MCENSVASSSGYSLKLLLGSSVLYSISDLALQLINFLLIPLYTRALTPDDYGIIGFITSLTQVLSPIVGLGLISSLPMLYYAYHGEDRYRLIGSVINFTFLYSLGMTLLILLCGQPIFARFVNKIPFHPYIVLSLITLFLSTFYFLPLGLFNMEERPFSYMVYSIGLSMLAVIATVVMVIIMRWEALGWLWAGLFAAAAGMLAALVSLHKYYRPVIDWDKLRVILRLSLPALPHAFSGTLWRFADRLFLINLSTLSTTGIYSLAMTISSIMLIVIGGATTALNPLFYRRANQGDSTLPVDWARLCSLFVFLVAWLGLGLALMGPELIQILTPPKFHAAIPLIPPLVLGQIFISLYWLLSPGIGYTRKTWVYPVASFPAMGINLMMNALLVPRYGAMGAAWAIVIAANIQCLIFGYFSLRYFPVPHEYSQIGKIVALGIFFFSISQLPFFQVFWVGLTFKPMLLALLPVGLWAWGFFSKYEIESAKKFMKKVWTLIPLGSVANR
jgi:O-antigen/teichoic acid export membrane protein